MDTNTRQSYRSVLTIKPFRILWFNEILVQLSYNMVNFALIVRVFTLTGRNTASSLFVLAAAIPALLFGAFTGVFADFFDKKRILLFTDFAIGLCFLSFIAVQHHVSLILLIAFFLNIAFQFFIPAEAATIPIIIPKKLLLSANALFYFVLTFCMIVGYTMAGPIVTHFGYTTIFCLAAGAMLIGFFLRGALPSLPSEHPDKLILARGEEQKIVRQTVTSVIEGFGFIRQNARVFIPTIILVIIQLIANVLIALSPGFMEEVLHIQAADASQVLLFPLGLGLIIGALAFGKFGDKIAKRHAIIIGIFVAAVAILGLGVGPLILASDEWGSFSNTMLPFFSELNVSIFVATCALILGVATSTLLLPAQTILQDATNLRIRGRVFAIVEVLKAVVSVLPVLLVGSLADLFGITPLLISVAVVLFLVGILALRFVSYERQLSAKSLKRWGILPS